MGKLKNLQASLESGRRQSEAELQAVSDAVRMLPKIELQINNLTRKVEELVLGKRLHISIAAVKCDGYD